ncbi:MAG: hypothetical protein HY927_03650 [Elusimicrobia bacterium]|nr:hypothetical protein [Elusimicrobiota bacterium]
MRTSSRPLALSLALCLGFEPGLLAAQTVQARVQPVPASNIGGMLGAGAYGAVLQGKDLRLTPTTALGGLPTLPSLHAAPSIQTRQAGPSSVSIPLLQEAGPSPAQAVLGSPLAASPQEAGAKTIPAASQALGERLATVSEGVAKDGKGLDEAPAEESHRAVARQFSLLTGERWAEPGQDDAASPKETPSRSDLQPTQPKLDGQAAETPAPQAQTPQAGDAPAKTGWLKVFNEPERNKSFWRYVAGYTVYIFGIEMYVVGLPYLISSFTRNLLKENNDARAAGEEAVRNLVRENRSLARIAHWVSQALSYASTPIFTRHPEEGPRKWLVRSFLIRAGVIALIPTLFFASGLFSLSAALWTLFGLIAVQSFFQGLSVTMESATTARIMGDASVTDAERTKANSILTFLGALVAIIGPALAGQISMIQQLFGKTGVGGAVIYGIYGIAAGLAGLIYATISIIGRRAKAAQGASSSAGADASAQKKPFSLKGLAKDLWTSLRDGVKLVFQNRFLRTMTFLTLLISLFSDPLVFNVLPEFVENLIASKAATVGAIMNVPVIGWFVKGLTSTPMGYYGMLVAFFSAGNILATLLMNPMKRLFQKLGFKSDEALTIPFFIVSMLEVPLFWALISATSMWAVLGLYGLTSLVTGFAAILLLGLHQKALGKYSDSDITKILAAESLLGILAAILSTYLYGFVLTGIPIAKALLLAAGAISVLGVLRLAAPWMFYSKAERQGKDGGKSMPRE